MTEPKLIYLEWRDPVKKDFLNVGDHPESVLLKGYTTLVDENPAEIVVSHFIGADEGMYFDRLAIPRGCIVRLDYIAEVKRGDAKDELDHGY